MINELTIYALTTKLLADAVTWVTGELTAAVSEIDAVYCDDPKIGGWLWWDTMMITWTLVVLGVGRCWSDAWIVNCDIQENSWSDWWDFD